MNNDETTLWTIMEYTSGEVGVITKWINKKKIADIIAKDDFHDILKFLSNVKQELWKHPDYHPFPKMDGIGWIRFKRANGVPLRVFGFFNEEENQYVMLIGLQKDGKKYKPSDAEKTAVKRKKEVLEGYDVITAYKL
jgi:hypothetical protein